MKVPLLDLKTHHKPIRRQLLDTAKKVIDSGHYILGPEVAALEKEIAAYSRVKFAVGVSSGTDALLLALMTAGIKPGDEIITSAFSFFATAGVIARLGATPVFADIDPRSYNLDASLLASAITPKTKAIIPVHLYGQCADMEPLLKLAAQRGLAVIEDAAQAIGAEYKGKRAGGIGLAGCLSFFPTKNLGALGDAGMLLTNDAAFARKALLLRVHGAEPKYYHKLLGANFRIDALQAALLRVKARRLDRWTAQRRQNAARYADLFRRAGLLESGVVGLPSVSHPQSTHGHIYHQYIIRVQRRDELRAYLKKKGIDTEIYYPLPLPLQECFKDLGYKPGDFPASEQAAQEILALPIYPELTRRQQAFVVDSIRQF
ncbi:MAG: transcriptional regulator [Elusimicrobia bacterium RIFCSPHIGHO2_02_FULL_57_9]|nr:MAG: transcriptional regulator [Elusimicrobia bacterium RIFCSPHIGHO2_02_FULL_57_9]